MNNDSSKAHGRAQTIIYWISTILIVLELIYGATWDFNWLNKGFSQRILTHLGYPSYLPAMLGVAKLSAAICFLAPRLRLAKEWAYAGVMFLFLGAVCSHLIVGHRHGTLIFLSICIVLTITSYCLRPPERRMVSHS